LENYVADSICNQPSPVPQILMTHEERCAIGSRRLLEALFEHHPELAPPNAIAPVATTPEPKPVCEVVLMPNLPTMEMLLNSQPAIRVVVDQVAAFYDLTPMQVCSDRRNANIVLARHVATWLCAELTTHSLTVIGRFLNKRDHSTCINALKKVNRRLKNDERFQDEIQVIKLRILDKVAGWAA
jgi:hypothetical protein